MKITFRLSSMKFGGAERVFLSVAQALAQEHAIEVHFVVDCIGQGETEHLVTEQGFKLFGLQSKRTATSILPFKQYIDTEKPDVIISGYTDTNMAALLSAKLASHRSKVIVSEHASLKEHWQHASRKRKVLLSAYVRFGYRLADHILAVSQGIAAQITQLGHAAEKVSYIYNPVRFNAKINSNPNKLSPHTRPTILSVGRITKQKDYLTLLQAFNLLIKNIDAQLMIVGASTEVEEKEKLEAYIAEHHLTEKVTFIGFTEHVHTYYEQVDVFALSSAWEGFGNVLVEALAFGLPVVSTDCNHGPAEILANGKYGQLVPVGNAKIMAQALQRSLESISHLDTQLLKYRSLDFSEQNIANQYWALIEKLTKV